MKARAVRRVAVGYLADLLDQADPGATVEDPEQTASALLDQAEDFRLTRDGRVVITWHLDNDGTPGDQPTLAPPPAPVDD